LRLFLEGRPIPDRPTGKAERLWRWCRRNPLLAALDAAVLGLLIVIAIGAPIAVWLLNAEREKAIAAKNDLEKANEDLEETLARSLLRPLGLRVQFKMTGPMLMGEDAGPLSEAEVESLWELAKHPNKRLGLLFIKNALRNSVTIRQLRNRAEFALQAAVGLDREKRAQVEGLLMEHLQDPKLNEHERSDIALIAAALGDLTPIARRQVAQVLLQGITKTPRNEELLEALGAVDSPQEAAQAFAIVIEDMEKTAMIFQEKQRCPEGLWAVAVRMEPQAAARFATSLTRALEANPGRYWLVDALSAAATAMEPPVGTSTMAEIGAKFANKLYRGPYTADNFEAPAKALSILARRMEPHAAVTTLTTAIAKVPETSLMDDWFPLAEALSALGPWMDPKDAAEAGQVLARVLARKAPNRPAWIFALSAVARRMDHQSAAKAGAILTEAISRTNRISPDLAEGLSMLAPRMQPKEAAAAGKVVAEKLRSMVQTTEHNPSGMLAKALAALAVQMEPNDAVRICSKVVSALIDFAIANKMPPTGPWDPQESVALALSALAPHIGPKDAATAAEILRKAMELAEEHSLVPLARSLSATAARIKRNEANKLCSQVQAILVRRIGKANHYYFEALSAVAAQMDPNEAARLCSQAAQVLSKKLDENDPNVSVPRYVARGSKAQILAAVAAHMEPKEGANTLFSAMDRSKGYSLALAALAEGLSEVAERMPRKEGSDLRKQAAVALIQALEHEEKRRGLVATPQMESDIRIAQTYLAGGLSTLAARMEPKDAASMLMEIMTKSEAGVLAKTLSASLTGVYAGSHRWSDFLFRDPIPNHALAVRLTKRELAELLKQPTCIGPARRLILDELENRYRCRFGDQWAFVRYAQENDLGLDLTGPPQRFGSPIVGEKIR
jgi:hypothetical protein